MLIRGLDVTLAGVGLLVLSPLMLIVGALILLTMGRPVLFTQTRAGQYQRPFRLRKFRSMAVSAAGPVSGTDDAARMTTLGRWLRKTSIDELPELWSVLIGEMSLVGPRPLLLEYRDVYRPEELLRFMVKPGLTGLAQVSGRNGIDWDQKLALDCQYVRQYSVVHYLRIVVWTFAAVARVSQVPDSAFEGEGRLDDARRQPTASNLEESRRNAA